MLGIADFEMFIYLVITDVSAPAVVNHDTALKVPDPVFLVRPLESTKIPNASN
jgi:hypothetical protein